MRSKLVLFALILSAGLSVTACDIQAGEGGIHLGVAAGKAQETWTPATSWPRAAGWS